MRREGILRRELPAGEWGQVGLGAGLGSVGGRVRCRGPERSSYRPPYLPRLFAPPPPSPSTLYPLRPFTLYPSPLILLHPPTPQPTRRTGSTAATRRPARRTCSRPSPQAQQDRLCKAAFEADQCLICLELTTLPCGHAFCTACVVELRAKGVSHTCPLCRAPLPPGPEKLFQLGVAVYVKINRAVNPSNTFSWPPLSASQQSEWDGAMVMMQEAADQVSGGPFSNTILSLRSRRSRRRLTSFATSLASRQGHIRAAAEVGSYYFGGYGVPVDYPRAMAAYEGGDAALQYMLGIMYYGGNGVDVDYKQARAWLEKAAAQDDPYALRQLGVIYNNRKGVTPSFRRAREYYERAIELGDSMAGEDMQTLTESIQQVTSQQIYHILLSSHVRDRRPHVSAPRTPSSLARAGSGPPSWTSGWRSTARSART